jgi:hypothetical protein
MLTPDLVVMGLDEFIQFVGRYKTGRWRRERDSNPRYPFG